VDRTDIVTLHVKLQYRYVNWTFSEMEFIDHVFFVDD